ncbi:DNA-binding transcriptional ArsR family regulator [Marmoricola sp. URHA0025 HA25]
MTVRGARRERHGVIDFELSVEALGNTRFGYSPLGEAASSLRLLATPSPGFVMQPWLSDVAGQLGSVDLELLRAVSPAGPWAPDFLFPWSAEPTVTIEHQLDLLAALPAAQIRRDMEQGWRTDDMPEVLVRLLADERPGAVIADAVWDYWEAAVAPYWSRIRAVLDDDVSYHGGRALSQGILTVFDDLHPEVSRVDRLIRVDKPHHASGVYTGDQITLVPSVFLWPGLIVVEDGENTFTLTYAARGVGKVWEGMPAGDAVDNDLGALLGRNRAAILRRLDIPMTTTQLARELGQSPGTVNQHLTVLKRNGLLSSWRSGRSVLYRRTALASSIIASSDHRQSAAELR